MDKNFRGFYLSCSRCGIDKEPVEDLAGQDASGVVSRHLVKFHQRFSFGGGVVAKEIPKLGIKITDHAGEEIILR